MISAQLRLDRKRLINRCLAVVMGLLSLAALWSAAPAFAMSPAVTVEVHQATAVPSSYFQLSANPGTTPSAGSIQLLNRTSRAVLVRLDPVDGITTNTLGSAYTSSGQAIHESARWLRLGSRHLRIPARSSRTVTVAMEVPRSAKPGDYLSGVAVQTVGQTYQTHPSHGLQIAEVYRYAVGVELKLPGPRTPHLRFTGANLERAPSSIVFSLLARNDGNVILQNVYGHVLVTQGNRVVTSAPIASGTFVSHTSIQMPIVAAHEHPTEGAVYRVRAKLVYKGGVAYLDTLVRFGHQAAVVQKEYTPKPKGYVLDHWALLGAGLALLALLLGVGWRRHRRRALLTRAATLALLGRMLAAVDERGQPQSVIHVEVKDASTAPKRRLAKTLRRQLRATDAIGDLGSDGLLILLPDTGGTFADSLADELIGLLRRTGEGHLVSSTEVACADRREDIDELVDWLGDRGWLWLELVVRALTHGRSRRPGALPSRSWHLQRMALPADRDLAVRLASALVATVLLACLILAPEARALSPFPELGYVTNGTVNTVAHLEGVTYIGGAFSQVGPATGPSVGVSLSTAKDLSLPRVWGGSAVIDAVAQDGKGGFFIGGNFTHVGGVACSNLAYIESTGEVNTSWCPGPNGTVQALTFSGATLYAGGSFTIIGTETREHIAAICATANCEGEVAAGKATAWNPGANASVATLAVSGTTVYAGGEFTTIGGEARERIAAICATANCEGVVAAGKATAWNPKANGAVNTVGVSGSTVYAGGTFTEIGESLRERVAAVCATAKCEGEVAAGKATAWNPELSGPWFSRWRSPAQRSTSGENSRKPAGLPAKTSRRSAPSPIAKAKSSRQSHRMETHRQREGPALAVSGAMLRGGALRKCGGKTQLHRRAERQRDRQSRSLEPQREQRRRCHHSQHHDLCGVFRRCP